MAERSLPPSGWIFHKQMKIDDGEPKVYYFRKSVQFETVPCKAAMTVSADSRYRLYVNGQSVLFGPCKGDGQVWYQDEADIAPYLQKGENVIAAVVLRYSLLHKGNHSAWRTDIPGFYLKGQLIFANGEEQSFYADTSWKGEAATHVKIIPENPYMQFLYINEDAMGDTRFKDWLLPGYQDGTWGNALSYHPFALSRASSPGNLMKRPVPPMYELERRFEGVMCVRQGAIGRERWDAFVQKGSQLVIPASQTEVVELNAGELTTGFLRFAFMGGQGARLEILSSEAYGYEQEQPNPYMPLPRKGDRTDFITGRLFGFTDVYTVAGYGTAERREEYEPFWFRTFRFIQLKITTGATPLTFANLHYRETGYPLEIRTHVQTSAGDMTDIWDISLRTLKRCMHETYEDCPFYEQLQYAMDTRSQILFTYYVSADDRLARRCIDDFHRSLRADGLTNCCFPSMGTNVIPGFSLYYVMMIHDHMMYFGDRELITRYFPTVEAILAFFERNRDERGLVKKIGGSLGSRFWSFIDWTAQWSATSGAPDATLQGPITMESLLYIQGLMMAAEMAEYVDRPEQAGIYRQRAGDVKRAVYTHCRAGNGMYTDGPGVAKFSQHCQVWAVLTETEHEENWVSLMEAALEQDGLTQCSVAMAFYLFRAVEKAGLYARTKVLWQPWRDMLAKHLTTCEEDPVTTRSDCHAWGALALYELPAAVLGVRPTKPGFAEVKIQPNLAFLDWAKGCVVTPKGIVKVEAERRGEAIAVSIQLPEGLKCQGS